MNVAALAALRRPMSPNVAVAGNSISVLEAQGRFDGFLDSEGFFAQSDEEFEAEMAGWHDARPMPLAA